MNYNNLVLIKASLILIYLQSVNMNIKKMILFYIKDYKIMIYRNKIKFDFICWKIKEVIRVNRHGAVESYIGVCQEINRERSHQAISE